MSPSTSRLVLKRVSLAVLSLAGVVAGCAYVQTLIHLDPFASLKKTTKELDPSLGVRFNGVHIESYDKEKLVTKADVDRMDVRQDKQHYDLFNVHNGTLFSDKGWLNFEAPSGQWNVPEHRLIAPQGAHVSNKDVNLKVPGFDFRSKKGIVNVPGAISGKFFGGDIKATNVQYNIDDKSYASGPMKWVGRVDPAKQDASLRQDSQGPRTWDIDGDETYGKGDIKGFLKAKATDGDIIVLADVIEHNEKTDVVNATGHVKYVSSKVVMICEKAVIERKIKKATMTGNVQMLVRAKEKEVPATAEQEVPPYRPIVPDDIAKNRPAAPATGQTEEQKKLDDEIRSGKNARDFPTICYAEKIEYWYKKGERHAIITGNPQARQELSADGWRQVWTTTGYYDGEKETLKMESAKGNMDTRMINSIGDDAVTTWIEVSTKDGNQDFVGGKSKARFKDYSDEVPRDKSTAPKTGKGDTGKSGTTGSGGTTGTTGGG